MNLWDFLRNAYSDQKIGPWTSTNKEFRIDQVERDGCVDFCRMYLHMESPESEEFRLTITNIPMNEYVENAIEELDGKWVSDNGTVVEDDPDDSSEEDCDEDYSDEDVWGRDNPWANERKTNTVRIYASIKFVTKLKKLASAVSKVSGRGRRYPTRNRNWKWMATVAADALTNFANILMAWRRDGRHLPNSAQIDADRFEFGANAGDSDTSEDEGLFGWFKENSHER